MPLHCMLHRVRLSSVISLDTHSNTLYFYSTCSSYMSAVTSWLWLPTVRSSHVQQTWIWGRMYDSCMPSYSIRMSCVRPFSSIFLPYTQFLFFSSKKISPILLWIYGRSIRMSSKYAHKPVHHPTQIKVAESESQDSHP
jgi:hypothetical protein